MNEGFWVLVWVEYGRGHTTRRETYKHLDREQGYSLDDEKELQAFAADWAQGRIGATTEYYRYGYEVVSCPPVEWIEREFRKIDNQISALIDHKTWLVKELGVKEATCEVP